MIGNIYIKAKKEKLIEKRLELAQKKQANNLKINSSGITSNARRYLNPKSINPEALIIAENAISENIDIDKQLGEIKRQLQDLHEQEETEQNKSLINIFKEIFNEEQLQEIYTESKRRGNGEHPFKISFAWKDLEGYRDNTKRYKKQIIEQLDTMVKFRMELTNLIDKGCEQFGKAEFLTFISPLNRLITPVAELEKIKRKIIG